MTQNQIWNFAAWNNALIKFFTIFVIKPAASTINQFTIVIFAVEQKASVVTSIYINPCLMFMGKVIRLSREALLKGKDQYSWPACNN
jgi:hypothetical protein